MAKISEQERETKNTVGLILSIKMVDCFGLLLENA